MSEILNLIGKQLTAESIGKLSRSIGASPEQTQQAVSAALPTLLGALTRSIEAQDGEKNLHNALLKDHDGSILDNLGALFGGGKADDAGPSVSSRTLSGGAILDHILGNKRQRVETGVSSASGLSTSQVMKLLAMIAPMIMGVLGRRRKQDDLSSGGLGDLLRSEKKQVESDSLGGGLMSKMFDQDGDGDFDMMDMMKFGAKKVFGRD